MRQITDSYFVSPQIAPDDVPALKAAGITDVICNRPDGEVPPDLQSEAMRIAVEAAGLTFHVVPLTHQTMTPDNVARQMELADGAAGPVLAYCASGTRCSVVWALGQAQNGALTTEEILSKTAAAGYDLGGLRATLDTMAAHRAKS